MNRPRRVFLGCFLWATMVGVAPAHATILTFQGGSGSQGGIAFPGGIPGVYGDHVDALLDGGVDQYDLIGNGLTPDIGAAWSGVMGGTAADGLFVAQLVFLGSLGELTLIPDVGYAVVLNSFVLAAMPFAAPSVQTVRVLAQDGSVLWDGSIPFGSPSSSFEFAPGVVSNGAIRLQFGPGTSGLGLVNFDERPATPIPEPSNLLLVAAGAVVIGSRTVSRKTH